MPSTEQLDYRAPAAPVDRERIPTFDRRDVVSRQRRARSRLVERVRQACLETGFFYVHSGGVGDEILVRALAAMQSFFALPDDSGIKQAVHNRHVGGTKGWTPKFGEPAYQQDTVAHVESFDIGQELRPDQQRLLELPPNLWPQLPGFRDAILAYYAQATRFGRSLSEIFAQILGADDDFLNRNSGEKAPRTMRLLHYAGGDAPVDRRQVGIAAHTDFECFTIMYQTAAGLELTDVHGRWVAAPSDPGAYTIILGDMLERYSNGWLKATGHRVAITPWSRYALILFFAVDGDCAVAPLPRFVDARHPPRYASVTQGEHIARELERAYANRARTQAG